MNAKNDAIRHAAERVRGGGSRARRKTASMESDGPKNTHNENNRAAARTRRQRGYQWEDTLVKRFNAQAGWRAFRLGSPSTGLPDVLAVNSKTGHLVVIEAKSGSGGSLVVPSDQVERCKMWADTFSAYKHRYIILAYKFSSKMRIGTAKYKSRELREFYKIRPLRSRAGEYICMYDGSFYAVKNDDRHSDDTPGRKKRVRVRNSECAMPFETRQPKETLADARIIF